MTEPAPARWWRGTRGEWYVVAQLVVMAVVFFGPRTLPGLPVWAASVARIAVIVGAVLMAAGLSLLLAALFRLGSSNLTPLPAPRTHATLVRTGAYGIVRHPMYAGGVLLAFGWALVVRGWLTLVYAFVLFVFVEIKSGREERWLAARFPEYPEYRRHVRKLIPFVH